MIELSLSQAATPATLKLHSKGQSLGMLEVEAENGKRGRGSKLLAY